MDDKNNNGQSQGNTINTDPIKNGLNQSNSQSNVNQSQGNPQNSNNSASGDTDENPPAQAPLIYDNGSSFQMPQQEVIRNKRETEALNKTRKTIYELNRQSRANGVYGDIDYNIIDFLKKGITDAAEIATLAQSNGLKLYIDPSALEGLNYTPEQKKEIEDFSKNLLTTIASGNVEIGQGYMVDNPYTRAMFKSAGKQVKFVGFTQYKYSQEETAKYGNLEVPLAHKDQYASSLGVGFDQNGNPRSLATLENTGNYLARETVQDPFTGAVINYWREAKPTEYIPSESIRSVLGDRQATSDTWVGSFGRGALAQVGKLPAGIGWVGGLFGAHEFENRMYNFGSSVSHQNTDETLGSFDDANAFFWQAGMTTMQTMETLAFSFAGGGLASVLGASAKGVSIASKAASLTPMFMEASGQSYKSLIDQGVDVSTARWVAAVTGGIEVATELGVGPNILIDPMKNRYSSMMLRKSVEKAIGEDYLKNGASLTFKKKVLNGLSRTVGYLDKTAAGRMIATTAEEFGEELTSNILNYPLKDITNQLVMNHAVEKLKDVDKTAKKITTRDGRVMGYTYVNKNGTISYMTADDYEKQRRIIDNGGVFSSDDMNPFNNLGETLAMVAIGIAPGAGLSFYGSNRKSNFDAGSMYDIAYGVASGTIKESDVVQALKELHNQNRFLWLKPVTTEDGTKVAEDPRGSYEVYEKSFLDELHTLVDVIKDNGLHSGKVVEAMSDINGMNRYVLHGSLSAALRIKEYSDAISNLENGKEVTDGRFVKSTMSIDEMKAELEKAESDMEYFAKPSGEEVEIGDVKLSGNHSKAVKDYYLHNSMIPQTIKRAIIDGLRETLAPRFTDPDELEKQTQSVASKMLGTTFFDNNIEKFLGEIEEDEKNPVKSFRDNRDGIEAKRNIEETSLLEQRKAAAEEAMAKREKAQELSKKLNEFANNRIEFKKLTGEKNRIINELQKIEDNFPEEDVDTSNIDIEKFQKEIDDKNEQIKDIKKQLIEIDRFPEGQDELVDWTRNNLTTKLNALQQENETNIKLLNKAKKNTYESLLNEVDEQLNKIGDINESGVKLSEELNSIEGILSEDDYKALEEAINNAIPDESESSEISEFEEALSNSRDKYLQNTKYIQNKHFEVDEGGNVIPKITPEESDIIFANSILRQFLSDDEIQFLNNYIEATANNEQVSLTPEESKMLESVAKKINKAKLYVFRNTTFYQKFIEQSDNKKTYTDLNNRTRIGKSVEDMLRNAFFNYDAIINHLAKNNKDLDFVKRAERFRVWTNHVNMNYIAIDAFIVHPKYIEILFGNEDSELFKLAEKFVYSVTDEISKYNAKYRTQYTNLIEMQNAFYNATDEQRNDMEQALMNIEKAFVTFGDRFYAENSSRMNSTYNPDGTVKDEGILRQIQEEMSNLASNRSPLGFNFIGNYLRMTSDVNLGNPYDIKKVVNENGDIKYVDTKTGQEVSTYNQFLAINTLNMLNIMGSVKLSDVYGKIREVVESNSNSTPVPTVEQQYHILNVVAHMVNPSNKEFDITETDAAKSLSKDYTIDKLIYIKGAAGSGKTSMIFKNAIKIFNALNGKTDKPKVLVVAPTIETGKLSENSFGDICDVEVITYHDLLVAGNNIGDSYDYILLDESTILSFEEIKELKKRINDKRATVVAIGDEFQTRSDDASIVPQISYCGKKTLRIHEQHRSPITTIRNLQESFVNAITNKGPFVFQPLQYKEVDGRLYGGMYFKTVQDVREAFLKDSSSDAILVVETEEEAHSLSKQLNRKVYSAQFLLSNVESSCVSGISAKRVYVAIGTSTIQDKTNNLINKILTAASRAQEFVALVGEGETTKVQMLSGLNEYLEIQKNGNNFEKDKETALNRLNQITNQEPSKDKDVDEQGKGKQESKDAKKSKDTKDNEEKDDKKEDGNPDEKNLKPNPMRTSRIVSKLTDVTMQGYNRIKKAVATVLSSFESPQIKVDENTEKYQIDKSDKSKNETVIAGRRRLLRGLINFMHEAFAISSIADDKELEQYVSQKYIELEESENPDSALEDPASIYRALKRNVAFMNFVQDQQRTMAMLFSSVIVHEGQTKLLNRRMFSYRLVGNIEDKPIINTTVFVALGDSKVLFDVNKLITDVSNNEDGAKDALKEALYYEGEDAHKKHIRSALEYMFREMAYNEMSVANRAYIGQHEFALTTTFVNKSNIDFKPIVGIDAIYIKDLLDDYRRNVMRIELPEQQEPLRAEYGALYGDKQMTLNEMVEHEKTLSVTAKQKQESLGIKLKFGNNIELREGRYVIYEKTAKAENGSTSAVNGEYNIAVIEFPFIRYIDGKPIPMLMLKNGMGEIPLESVLGTSSPKGYDSHEENMKLGNTYIGTYYRPAGVTDEKYETLRSARQKAIAYLGSQTVAKKLQKDLIPQIKLGFFTGGKYVEDTLENVIVYRLSISDLMALKDLPDGNPSKLTEEEYNILVENNVIGIEGSVELKYENNVPTQFSSLKRNNTKVHPVIDKFITEALNGKNKISGKEETIKEKLKEDIKKYNEENKLPPIKEVYLDAAVNQAVYVVMKRLNMLGQERYAVIKGINGISFHNTNMNGDTVNYNDLPSIDEFESSLKGSAITNGMTVEESVEKKFYSESEGATERYSSKREIASGVKPVFYVTVTDSITGQSVMVRAITPMIDDLSDTNKKIVIDLMVDDLKKLAEISGSSSFNTLEGSFIEKFIRVNNRQIINALNNADEEFIEAFNKLFYITTIKGNKYVRISKINVSDINDIAKKFAENKDALATIINKLGKSYIPVEAINTSNNELRNAMRGFVHLLVGKAEGSYVSSPGMFIKTNAVPNNNVGNRTEEYSDKTNNIRRFGGFSKKYVANQDNLHLIDYVEAKRMLTELLGEKWVEENFEGLEENLRNPVTKVELLGYVYRAKMKLRSFNGKVDKTTLVHETAHVVYEYMLKDSSRVRIINELKSIYGNTIDVSEKIAEIAEKGVSKKYTMLDRFVAMVKHVLYQIGLYTYSVDSFVDGLMTGQFRDSSMVIKDNDIHEKRMKYGSLKPLIDMFGSEAMVATYVKRTVVPIIRENLYLNKYINRSDKGDLESAVKGAFTKIYSGTVARAELRKGNISDYEKKLFSMSRRELGNVKFPINGTIKAIKDINIDDINWLEANEQDESVGIILDHYFTYKLYNKNIVKSLIQQALKDIDISKLLPNKNELKNVAGNETSGVIRNDNSAETTDLFRTMSPFVKFVISTIPYYGNIEIANDTIYIQKNSKYGYVNDRIAYNVLMRVGQLANIIDPDGKDQIGAFFKALQQYARDKRGEERNIALSLLAEFGNLEVEMRDENGERIEYNNLFNRGYYGMTTISDEEIEANRNYSPNKELIRNKGHRILTEFLIPMINSFRSQEERNTVDIEFTDGKVYILENTVNNDNKERSRVRENLRSQVYDEGGYVSEEAYQKIFSKVEVKSDGLYIKDGDKSRKVLEKHDDGSITVFDSGNIQSDVVNLLKVLGITINVKTAYAIANSIKYDSIKKSIDFNGLPNMQDHLYMAFAGIMVNHNLSQIDRQIDENIKVITAARTVIDGIEDVKNLKEEEKFAIDKKVKAEKEYQRLMQERDKLINETNTFSGNENESDYKFVNGFYSIEHGVTFDEVGESFGDRKRVSPHVYDDFKLLNSIGGLIGSIRARNGKLTHRNREGKIEQNHIVGSQFTRLFQRNGNSLISFFNRVKSIGNNVLSDGIHVFSIFSNYAKPFAEHIKSISIFGVFDIENLFAKASLLHYNKSSFVDRMHAFITDGFVNKLLEKKEKDRQVLLPVTPHSDRRNSKMIKANIDSLVSLHINSETGNITGEVNKQGIVNAIYQNVLMVDAMHKQTSVKVLGILREFADMVDTTVDRNSFTESNIPALFEILSSKYGKLFADYAKSKLIKTKEYEIVKGKVVPGNAINLNHPHNIYTKDFVDKFMSIQQSNLSNQEKIEKAYELTKMHFKGQYKQFIDFLDEIGYTIPKTYALDFNKSKAEEFDANTKALLQKNEKLHKDMQEKFFEDKKVLANNKYSEADNEYSIELEAIALAKKCVSEKVKLRTIDGVVNEEGEYTEAGARAKELVREYVDNIKKVEKGIKKEQDKIYEEAKKYSQDDYIDPENELNWNPIYEGYFFAYHIVNNEIDKVLRLGSFMTKNLIESVKRNAGTTAPAITPTVGIKYGLPNNIRYSVVDFGGGSHPQVVDEKGEVVFDPELKSNGQGLLNPIAAIWMQNSFGKEFGPVGSTMVKNVTFYNDVSGNTVPYLKQAMRRITGTSILLSKTDFQLFKYMNRNIWDIAYDSERTIGQVFEQYVARESNESFDEIVSKVVEVLEMQPELKEEVDYQVVDPSAVKTGATGIISLAEAVGLSNGQLIEELEKSGEIQYLDDENKPCNPVGELKAADGVTNAVYGTDWTIVKDFSGMPKHSEGGVDITIINDGVIIKGNGKELKAKHGLFIPNDESLPTSDLYRRKTGKDWNTAIEEGLTSGSKEDNMRLRQMLLSGQPLVKNESNEPLGNNA